ncbi:acyl-CoA dehydrogenase family protein [Phaeacidiphilus oryzae]|uniref:acyl-CoA dehydrogenase family protein n=1 Tax=Phaeacidiphilus oryzae TaxID=348818 RepID=UPI00055D9A34|nr:acyl-CoA dehydrogenase family protein [Phaeacidiphilus oryzae]
MSTTARATVDRQLPTEEAAELLALTRELADRELRPRAAACEAEGRFPREVFRTLGRSGLLGLPYPAEYGGGEQPYEVYLQVLEELASAWLTVAMGISVHTLSCHAPAVFGSAEQRRRWLPEMLGGELLGAYCLSEPQSGSDAAALRTRAVLDPRAGEGGEYTVEGTKAWITHGGRADFYTALVRTADTGSHGITALLIPGDAPGLTAAAPERKMGLSGSPTAQLHFDGVRVPAERRIGAEGQGFPIALAALDSGRLGIAACAVGLARAAVEYAAGYAREREQFGHPIARHQGVSFLLADMATAVEAGRSLYLAAARRRDSGRPFGKEAAMAKLFCTDAAMRLTTDAVQVLGGYGYTADHPVERWMREAKALQIVEGTNQVQRMVIGRHLLRPEDIR